MWTKALNPAVTPIPILQIFNIIVGLLGLCWEYPLPYLIPNTSLHRSIAARLFIYPISVVLAALIYQGTNAAIYYIVGLIVYFWGYSEGEVRHPEQYNENFPWLIIIQVVCMPWKIPTGRFITPQNIRKS